MFFMFLDAHPLLNSCFIFGEMPYIEKLSFCTSEPKFIASRAARMALGSSGCVPRQNGNLCASFSILNSSTLTSCCICVVKFPLTIILRMSLAWIHVFVYFLILAAYILQYLEEGRAACSSILAWRIPVDSSEELGVLQSMGSQRIGHSWATKCKAQHVLQ